MESGLSYPIGTKESKTIRPATGANGGCCPPVTLEPDAEWKRSYSRSGIVRAGSRPSESASGP